jgi:hypothetical protein
MNQIPNKDLFKGTMGCGQCSPTSYWGCCGHVDGIHVAIAGNIDTVVAIWDGENIWEAVTGGHDSLSRRGARAWDDAWRMFDLPGSTNRIVNKARMELAEMIRDAESQ